MILQELRVLGVRGYWLYDRNNSGVQIDGSVMANALGVVAGPQAEVETQDNQVGDVSVFYIGG